MLKILIAEPERFSPLALARLSEVGKVTLRAVDREGLRCAFQEYDVVWFRLAHRIDATMLGDKPRCRILATPVTGLDHIDLEACAARGVRVVSLKGETEFLRQVRATAELTVGLMLALMRKIPQASRSVQEGHWQRDLFAGHELYGKTAAIIGVGRLGSIVAAYLRAFGMHVVGYDPRPDFPSDACVRAQTLGEVLQQADVVSLHVSYSPATRHLIGATELAAMKPEAVLINTSRGGVVDEVALLKALESGRLAGAALDVLDGEPHIDGTHPLVAASRRLDNLLVIPHLGGNTSESFEKTERFLAERVVTTVIAGFGLDKGLFQVPDDFDAPLPEDVLRSFEE